MKRIIIPLFLSFFAVNAFAMTAEQVLLKAEKVNFLYSGHYLGLGATFVLESEVFHDAEKVMTRTLVVDKDKRKETTFTNYGNGDFSETVSLTIPGKGAWITVTVAKDGETLTDTRYTALSKDAPSKSEVKQFNAQLSKIYSMKFAKENEKNKEEYVIEASLPGLIMKLFINRKDFLIREQRNIIGEGDDTDTIVTVYYEYKKVFGNYYYPFIKDSASSRNVVATEKVTSFKALNSKDVQSSFIVPKVGKTQTKTDAVVLSTDSTKSESKADEKASKAESKKDDNNFGKEVGKTAENAAKDETKDQIKRGVKKGVSGVFKGIF